MFIIFDILFVNFKHIFLKLKKTFVSFDFVESTICGQIISLILVVPFSRTSL